MKNGTEMELLWNSMKYSNIKALTMLILYKLQSSINKIIILYIRKFNIKNIKILTLYLENMEPWEKVI